MVLFFPFQSTIHKRGENHLSSGSVNLFNRSLKGTNFVLIPRELGRYAFRWRNGKTFFESPDTSFREKMNNGNSTLSDDQS